MVKNGVYDTLKRDCNFKQGFRRIQVTSKIKHTFWIIEFCYKRNLVLPRIVIMSLNLFNYIIRLSK